MFNTKTVSYRAAHWLFNHVPGFDLIPRHYIDKIILIEQIIRMKPVIIKNGHYERIDHPNGFVTYESVNADGTVRVKRGVFIQRGIMISQDGYLVYHQDSPINFNAPVENL